ncbi:MAG: hypothetical protein ACE1ZA_09555, partial [Pseudomonadales bacterium]
MAEVVITPRDRLGFTLFLAISLHAAIILGVSFTSELSLEQSPTIEVTIAQHSDSEVPEDADFIAQANQLGSGDADEVLETTTKQQSYFHDNKATEVISEPMPATPQTLSEQPRLHTTSTSSEDSTTTELEVPIDEIISPLSADNLSYEDLAKEIASLEARIAETQQTNARRPRIKRLTSVSTKSAYEAAYLNTWRKKVERIGTANYQTLTSARSPTSMDDATAAKAIDRRCKRCWSSAPPAPSSSSSVATRSRSPSSST